jgi:hypothetical protein
MSVKSLAPAPRICGRTSATIASTNAIAGRLNAPSIQKTATPNATYAAAFTKKSARKPAAPSAMPTTHG